MYIFIYSSVPCNKNQRLIETVALGLSRFLNCVYSVGTGLALGNKPVPYGYSKLTSDTVFRNSALLPVWIWGTSVIFNPTCPYFQLNLKVEKIEPDFPPLLWTQAFFAECAPTCQIPVEKLHLMFCSLSPPLICFNSDISHSLSRSSCVSRFLKTSQHSQHSATHLQHSATHLYACNYISHSLSRSPCVSRFRKHTRTHTHTHSRDTWRLLWYVFRFLVMCLYIPCVSLDSSKHRNTWQHSATHLCVCKYS